MKTMATCDLVMKGGIASGVVYPKAITELAKRYRFIKLGGTSAGAIAAGLTAAAEYCRSHGSNSGFEALDTLPHDISRHLLALFQPHPDHRRVFTAMLKLMNGQSRSLVWFFIRHGWHIRKSIKRLPQTYFGLCSGMTTPGSAQLGLTDWLNLWLETCAGRLQHDKTLPATPLTFGDLAKQGVTLRMVSTNLSQQTPVNLPHLGYSLAKKSDLERLLPATIVHYIQSKQTQLRRGKDTDNTHLKDFLIIPCGDDLPVLMAIRMSISFPLLLAAIPLYRYDWSRRRCLEQQQTPRCCWFSDGGISSNFPIHLFDRTFPSRPTFGIALTEYSDDRQMPDDDENINSGHNRVYLPIKANEGRTMGISDISNLVDLFKHIFNTAQNWQETTQSILPGYRERIIQLALKPEEGGLNLSMNDEDIYHLSDIGLAAGQRVCEQFSFDEHRWRRLLSAYAAIEAEFEALVDEYYSAKPESMNAFLQRYRDAMQDDDWVASSYKPKHLAQFDELKARLDQLMALAKIMQQQPLRNRWGNGTMPKPSARLTLSPEQFSQ